MPLGVSAGLHVGLNIHASDRPWLAHHPAGVAADVNTSQFASVATMLDAAFATHAEQVAFCHQGRETTYAQIDELSLGFSAYLQSLGLKRGDRVACLLPNNAQFALAVPAILRAGLALVQLTPQVEPREMGLQLKDSGSKAIVLMESAANDLSQCIAQTDVTHVVLAAPGDMRGWLSRMWANLRARRKYAMPKRGRLPNSVGFAQALDVGRRGKFKRPALEASDIALLRYARGSTARGAAFLQSNIVANVLQAQAVSSVCSMAGGSGSVMSLLLAMRLGNSCVDAVDPSGADPEPTHLAWPQTNYAAAAMPRDSGQFMPLPSTMLMCIDGLGREVPSGETGELAIRGPQVMAGYWQRAEDTHQATTEAGYFRTGSMGVMDARGLFSVSSNA